MLKLLALTATLTLVSTCAPEPATATESDDAGGWVPQPQWDGDDLCGHPKLGLVYDDWCQARVVSTASSSTGSLLTPAQRQLVDRYQATLDCIAARESGGRYDARNPSSSAAGRYQWLSSSWRAAATRAAFGAYADRSAATVPAAIQDVVTATHIRDYGLGAWAASNGARCSSLMP